MTFRRSVDLVAEWQADVDTAMSDLEATGAQAFVLAAHALAWRTCTVTLPIALAVAGALILRGEATPGALPIGAVIGLLGPQALAGFLTFPVMWAATLQTWFRGSRDARLRFGITSFVYNYYGWRYAFRGRRRPWGAMTRKERALSDPRRAGPAVVASVQRMRADRTASLDVSPESWLAAGASAPRDPGAAGLPVAVVEQVARLRQQGVRLTSIADQLNSSGVPVPHGAETWGAPAVAALLEQHRTRQV